jgi:hypothetical protein
VATEDAEEVERLYLERLWRKTVLDQIRDQQLPVPQELLVRYRRESADYALQLQEAIARCLLTYAHRCPKQCLCPRVDFREKKLYWREARHAEAD